MIERKCALTTIATMKEAAIYNCSEYVGGFQSVSADPNARHKIEHPAATSAIYRRRSCTMSSMLKSGDTPNISPRIR